LTAQNKLLKAFSEKFKKNDFWKAAGGDSWASQEEINKAKAEENKKLGFKWMVNALAQDVFVRKT
jgi:hypothetical protein